GAVGRIEKLVAVVGGLRNLVGADPTAAAGSRFDHERLSERPGHAIDDDPAREIAEATRGIRDDHSDRLRRIGLRVRSAEGGGRRWAEEPSPSGTPTHRDPPKVSASRPSADVAITGF